MYMYIHLKSYKYMCRLYTYIYIYIPLIWRIRSAVLRECRRFAFFVLRIHQLVTKKMGCASHILFMFNISDFSNQMSLPAATLPATCYLQPQPKSNKKSCVFLFWNIAALFGKKTSCSGISYTDWLRPLMFYLLIIEANRYALRPCSQHPAPPHHASSSPTSSSSFIPKLLLYNPHLL